MSSPPTVVSSPGKVLITGGYLVLDPKYPGTVISTSSRFYTVVREAGPNDTNHIRVRSPQFLDATWEYIVTTEPDIAVKEDPANHSKNKFVQLALQNTIALSAEVVGPLAIQDALEKGLHITIVGDNDFYSQREKLASLKLPRTLDSLSQITPFTTTGVNLSQVHKTGLGSSAALITSLVSALLLHFSAIPTSSFEEDKSDGRRLAHNLAQYVHCLAQGKVGSGFDVSAAVFGSHLYTRFDPEVIHTLMNDDGPLLPVLSHTNETWGYRVEPFKLPPFTRIMLADIDAGSDTPSLVGKVLKWRSDNSEEASILWDSLNQLNQALARALSTLSTLYEKDPENYTTAVKYISSLQSIQWEANPAQPEGEIPIVSEFYEAHRLSQAIRAKMREMGKLSGVPIEPDEQTKLLNSCVSLAGVIGGGVPGAGGYDAIWLLVCDPVDASPDKHPIERVERVWSEYKDLNVSPLSVVESLSGGARIEVLEKITGLSAVVQ
ncbi:phosphomevalonate kinase [Collybia nuda]|uniref:Phosphomevalonate kinase n=1 Tax=Collybia nuda TaxID=64659 RepID=A0A9P5Y1R1_9AGAR|nr:phosphomevalonate kinase [Collybia nuda]